MRPARDQPGDVRHVKDVDRAHFVGDLAHAREIPETRIRAGAADDYLRLFALGDRFELVVVDEFRVAPHRVERWFVELSAEAELVAVGEVTAVGQIEAEDRVACLQNRHVGRGVGLRAGVRLNVGVLGSEDLLGTVACQIFNHVSEFAPAIVAASRIAFGILVGKDRARGFKHRLRDEVLAGNHLQPFVLAEGFVVNGCGDFGIGLGEGKSHTVSHRRILGHLTASRRLLKKLARSRGSLLYLFCSGVRLREGLFGSGFHFSRFAVSEEHHQPDSAGGLLPLRMACVGDFERPSVQCVLIKLLDYAYDCDVVQCAPGVFAARDLGVRCIGGQHCDQASAGV